MTGNKGLPLLKLISILPYGLEIRPEIAIPVCQSKKYKMREMSNHFCETEI